MCSNVTLRRLNLSKGVFLLIRLFIDVFASARDFDMELDLD